MKSGASSPETSMQCVCLCFDNADTIIHVIKTAENETSAKFILRNIGMLDSILAD